MPGGVSGTPFARFAEVCRRLADTASRDEKVDLVAAFLDELAPDERAAGARFLAGQTLAAVDPRSVDVGHAVLESAEDGDQAALTPGPLTVRGLARAIDELADLEGEGSRDRRRAIVGGLVGRLEGDESDWLARLFLGELRTGVQEGLVLEAIAEAGGIDPDAVRRAMMFRGDVGEVAHLALDGGPEVLDSVDLELGRPIRPMLAGSVDDVQEALVELGGPLVCEHKLDGVRVQIHRMGETVRVFSRRLTEVTDRLPEAVEAGQALSVDQALVEGEAYAVDEHGQPRAFQDLMQRFREHDRAAAIERVPVRVRLFDCLASHGDTLVDDPLSERWARLREIAPSELLVERVVTGDPGEARAHYEDAIGLGHEGAILKDPDSAYTPGRRGEAWRKLKPVETLDLVVLGAEFGHGRREGWLSNLHLGARVPDEERSHLVEPEQPPDGPLTRREGFAMVGKTFKGMTDDQLDRITRRLDELAEIRHDWGVEARPELVVEVAFDAVQDSPVYESGLALRFARVTALREDLDVEDAATLEDVLEHAGKG